MRYKVKGLEIKSENAAKSHRQASRYLLRFIKTLPKMKKACDYGCGKLRYAKPLSQRCRQLALVDSAVQLERKQVLFGDRTTIREYVGKRLYNARTMTVEEFDTDDEKYDFVLCANVLSAIPQVRVRSFLLRSIFQHLAPSGRCLFVTQFRNSYFKQMIASSRSIPHLDGWILPSKNGASYYGIISPKKLMPLLKRHGYTVHNLWVEGQSAFALVGT